MKRGAAMSLAVAAVVTLGVGDAVAQDEDGRRGWRGGVDVEAVMSMRDRLELTDDQIQQLDAWRGERVAVRNEERAQMEELRSRLRAGQIQRSDVMAHMEERREEMRARQDASRSRLEGILDESQIGAYDGIVRERRAFARGRASAQRGNRDGFRGRRDGVRGGRGAVRGGRGAVRGGRGAVRGGRGVRPGRPGSGRQ